jgi:hypothetical protein
MMNLILRALALQALFIYQFVLQLRIGCRYVDGWELLYFSFQRKSLHHIWGNFIERTLEF